VIACILAIAAGLVAHPPARAQPCAQARNDTAVLWPMGGGAPWVITAYLQAADIRNDQRASVLAQVGRIADRLIG
ncbi:hypothetical protein, partial [Enterobacter hormaechei]|uniref:hypothetical protein n=1 Tax=Enterobacter hormaechei TaxID=158836 RepID=UPI0035A3B1C3